MTIPNSLVLGLDAWYKQVPPAEDAALICAEAFALPVFGDSFQLSSKLPQREDLPPRGQKLTGEAKDKLAAVLAESRAALDVLHSIPPAARSRYPIDLKQGALTLLPHLGKSKGAINLLGAEALLYSANGQPDNAVQSLEAAGRVTESLGEEPLLISHLVRIAEWAIIISRVERILNETALSDAQLAQLQKALAPAERPASLARVLAGERAFGLSIFIDQNAQRQMFSSAATGTTMSVQNLSMSAGLTLLKVTGLFQKDKAFFLDVMSTNVAAAELDYSERLKRGQQAASLAASSHFCIFSRMLLPALSKVFLRDAEHIARLRVAQTAVAIERYCLAHGNALPASLDQLVPNCLDYPLLDPIDDQPLRFKKTNRSYVVYSIGVDGNDDGGLEPNPKQSSAPHDVTFVVER
jgi:hypothetical protein